MEVGNYARTNYGTIFKIENIKEIDVNGIWFKSKVKENSIIKTLPQFMYDEEDEIIIKTSPNIIDLIEVGDYVNGCYVTNRQASHNEGIIIIPKRIGIIKCNAYFNQGNYYDCEFKWIEEKDIKSIVTKERFEAMQHKVIEE